VTRQNLLLIIGLVIAGLLLAALGLAVLGAIANHRAQQSTPQGPADPPTLVTPIPFPAFEPAAPPRPIGRHHEDTVRRVPDDWMPITGSARLRALEQTSQFPRPDLSPLRKEGGS
jgi:hypothetical protein